MKISFKRILQDLFIAYIVIAIDVLDGFKTYFNFLNWDSNRILKFFILLSIIMSINFIVFFFLRKNNKT